MFGVSDRAHAAINSLGGNCGVSLSLMAGRGPAPRPSSSSRRSSTATCCPRGSPGVTASVARNYERRAQRWAFRVVRPAVPFIGIPQGRSILAARPGRRSQPGLRSFTQPSGVGLSQCTPDLVAVPRVKVTGGLVACSLGLLRGRGERMSGAPRARSGRIRLRERPPRISRTTRPRADARRSGPICTTHTAGLAPVCLSAGRSHAVIRRMPPCHRTGRRHQLRFGHRECALGVYERQMAVFLASFARDQRWRGGC
jgi:hypothetical protein